jgi:hypothetical protein
MQLWKELDLYATPANCANVPGFSTRHQVRHAQHLSMASVVSEMGDSEVFDELPHWDDEEMFVALFIINWICLPALQSIFWHAITLFESDCRN